MVVFFKSSVGQSHMQSRLRTIGMCRTKISLDTLYTVQYRIQYMVYIYNIYSILESTVYILFKLI